MKILVTGAKGFVGKNLIAQLYNIRDNKARWYSLDNGIEVLEYDQDSEKKENDFCVLEAYCKECDIVVHLAGVNRPKNNEEFKQGNFSLLERLLNLLKKHNNLCSIILSSSIQAELNNPYGESKLLAENLLKNYAKSTGAKIKIYRFSNIFGKWAKENYNSVVATFCYNIAREKPIQINNEDNRLNLIYIDDVVDNIIRNIEQLTKGNEAEQNPSIPSYSVTVGELAEKIYSFSQVNNNLALPNMTDDFTKKLYATFLSYMPADKLCFDLQTKTDERGSFTEVFKSLQGGQISINSSKPKAIKGQHWHNTKVEKFIVLKGSGLVRMRKIGLDKNALPYPITEYLLSEEKIKILDIIPGYTHSIKNISDKEDLIFLIWSNEEFNPQRPDTYYEEV
ncbi:MAG: NAD-dependent epimerase/dehydratase family protein [Bacteroidota bacterium]|nr:NAD-dependent epimerase/dehydratase family protein [Bacteroidota bacterium]